MNDWKGIGNLVRDPELSYTPNTQMAKCVFTIAVNRPKKNGEDQGADYIRIVAWGKRGETCDKYLSKGSKVGVSGPIRTGSYKDRDGRTVYTTDVWATEVDFIGTYKKEKPAEEQSQPQPQQEQMAMGFNDLPETFSETDDDIPF